MYEYIILEDSEERARKFSRAYGSSAEIRSTVKAFVFLMNRAIRLKRDGVIIFLDHDLGNNDIGMDAVNYLIDKKEDFLPLVIDIIIHTMNPVGQVMELSLIKAGYPAKWIPFPNLKL